MDFYWQKARILAMETAKKSQEVANQAAKLSQQLATETAKRSKELAIDVTKRADQLKAYAGDLTPIIAAKGSALTGPPPPNDEELEEYGITPDFREFMKGLTIKTFRDFPVETDEEEKLDRSGTPPLTPWREKHAVLVLVTIKEINDFRYVLCPRRMNESRFWRIYFTLVNSQIVGYEEKAMEKARLEEESKRSGTESNVAVEHGTRDLDASAATSGQGGAEAKDSERPVKSNNADHDLDAYLAGGLDSDDEGADGDGDDDDGFDEDFDQLVNSAVDSDHEDDALHSDKKRAERPIPSSSAKPVVAASEGSSDGELVEIPDSRV